MTNPPMTYPLRQSGPSPATALWAARQVVRQHTEPPDENRATGHCGQCRDGGCSLLAWADALLGLNYLAGHT
jgi:hypothetical protein